MRRHDAFMLSHPLRTLERPTTAMAEEPGTRRPPHADEQSPLIAGRLEQPAAGAPAYLARIAVRSINRIVIVPVAEIVRLEAEDNYVRIWADRPYLQKETLTGLMSRLDPVAFLRVHRSHAVNIALVRELRPQIHGEYLIVLANGTEIISGRSYRQRIQEAFGLGRGQAEL